MVPNCALGLGVYMYSSGLKGALKTWVRFPSLLLVQVAAPLIWTATPVTRNNTLFDDEIAAEKENVLKGKCVGAN